MGARLHLWWQYIRQHRLLSIGIIVALIVLTAFALAVWMFGWDWTGFNGGYSTITTMSTNHGTTTVTMKPPGKTLWDWLQLLIIPVVLTIGGLWFTARQNHDLEIAKNQHEHDNMIALDNQREVALQAYIDKMSELILEKNLLLSKPDDEVRNIATARTLTVLPNLDSLRKRRVIKFLHDAGLIKVNEAVIDLMEADLSGAGLGRARFRELNLVASELNVVDLSGANLSGTELKKSSLLSSILYKANLREADLSEASLFMTNFIKADLKEAKLVKADLTGAWLMQTDLREADLSEAHMFNGNLREADLSLTKIEGADLTQADLTGAKVTKEQLETVKSLKDAIMPDGSKHP